jgi:hypothetical protein
MIYPRRETLARIEPGEPFPHIALGPYETVMLETVEASDAGFVRPQSSGPTVSVMAGGPTVYASSAGSAGEDRFEMRYAWSGTLDLPVAENLELCILVEGEPTVEHALAAVSLGDKKAKVSRSGSARQFGAAVDASPDNWTWFRVPLPSGRHPFLIDVRVPVEHAAIGVYVRGAVAAASDPAVEGQPAFPLYRADRRAWSQTLAPLQTYEVTVARR